MEPFNNGTFTSKKGRLEITFQRIAVDIVEVLGYAGSMIAMLEDDGALPVYAFYVDPSIASIEKIKEWEQNISGIIRRKISISDPQVARVYVHDKEYQANLSVKALQKKQPQISNNLLDLFVPIVPSNRFTKPIVNEVVQRALGIKQVVAIPFFLDPLDESEPTILGNLFAAKRSAITEQDIQVLTSFGRQAAATIEIEHQREQVIRVARHLTTEIQTRIRNEDQVLQQIAEGLVSVLGYAGAMVATYEADDSLPVRAFYIDPKLVSMEDIASWETRISSLIGRKVSVLDPDIARVYVNKPGYEENLSVQAVRQRKPVIHDELITLLTPIVPSNKFTRPFVNSVIQKALNITQVVAIPFFLQASDGGDPQIVGNLFAATTHPKGFQNEEVELLQAFGQQAAAGIFNAQLYRYIDEQRQAAQIFGMMAFGASKSIHQFKNHLGFIRGQLQLLSYIDQVPDSQKQEILSSAPRVIKRVDILSKLLEQLHEPWRPINVSPTNVNTCLRNARDKILPENSSENIRVELDLAETLPSVETSPDMLLEAFSILMKNAKEAIETRGSTDGHLRITSRLCENSLIEVQIEDNGTGIKPEDKRNVFEMRWSTKESGLGFGLFWAKDFIEGLGGKIWVDSVWQQKTIFYVELPINANN